MLRVIYNFTVGIKQVMQCATDVTSEHWKITPVMSTRPQGSRPSPRPRLNITDTDTQITLTEKQVTVRLRSSCLTGCMNPNARHCKIVARDYIHMQTAHLSDNFTSAQLNKRENKNSKNSKFTGYGQLVHPTVLWNFLLIQYNVLYIWRKNILYGMQRREMETSETLYLNL